MTRPSLRLHIASLVFLALVMTAMPASSVTVSAGWTRSDVGLQNKGDGWYAGVANDIPMTSNVLDVSYSLEYVQKVGSQPTFFTDPGTGLFTTNDAEVTLHYLQPAIFLGARIPGLGFVPRIYVGGSVALKVKESWSDFPGDPDLEWGYKNTDIAGHLGVSLQVGPVLADFRFTQGFTGQLLQDSTLVAGSGAKAEVGPEGAHEPEVGAKISLIQLGVGFSF